MARPRKKLTRGEAERNALAVQWLPLVRRVVNDLWPKDAAVRRLGHEEAVSAGNLALLRAAERWEEGGAAGWPWYAYRAIALEVRRAAKYGDSLVHVPAYVLDGSLAGEDSPAAREKLEAAGRALAVACLDDCPPQAARPAPEPARGKLHGLPPSHRRILELVYVCALPAGEVAAEMGLDPGEGLGLLRAALANARRATGLSGSARKYHRRNYTGGGKFKSRDNRKLN